MDDFDFDREVVARLAELDSKKLSHEQLLNIAARATVSSERWKDIAINHTDLLKKLFNDAMGLVDQWERSSETQDEERKRIKQEMLELEEKNNLLARELADAPLMIKKTIGQSGKRAQDAKLDPARAYARELASKKPYPSRRQAVRSIKSDVLAFVKTLDGVSLSADQAEKTIDGWLKKSGYTPTAGKRGTSARKWGTSAS